MLLVSSLHALYYLYLINCCLSLNFFLTMVSISVKAVSITFNLYLHLWNSFWTTVKTFAMESLSFIMNQLIIFLTTFEKSFSALMSILYNTSLPLTNSVHPC